MAYLGPSLRRAKLKERPGRRAAAALAASVALNALALWALAARGVLVPPHRGGDPARVALAPLSRSAWEANRAVAPRPPAEAPPQEDASGKVVELSPEQEAAKTPPANARFLSDRNTQVEKETVSRHAGVYPRPARKPEPPQEPGRAAAGGGAARSPAPGREGREGERLAAQRPSGELRVPELGEGGEGGARPPGQGAPDLSVSREALARIAGGPSMDGVGEGLEEGEETWLRSREFRYATFMNQMRREIGEEWYPRVREAQHDRDPDGSMFFYKERTVVLGLTIDTDGNVKDLSVMQSSTIDFFDRVAVTSVRAAQPFPNPPRGMFHSGEEVRIPFAFTLYPGSRRGAVLWRSPQRE